jgi:hypothetical protein
MGKIPLPEPGIGKGNVFRGEERASGLRVHLFCQLLLPIPGSAGGKKIVRSCLAFSTHQTLLNFGELGLGSEG